MAKTLKAAADPQQMLNTYLPFIRDGKLDALEEQWLESHSAIPAHPDFFKNFLLAMRKAGHLDRAESLVTVLIEERLKEKGAREALRILLAVIPFFPNSAALRPLLAQALRGHHAGIDEVDHFIRASGLESDRSLVDGYKNFRDWTRLAPGQVYQHYDWGEGVIQKLDLAGGKVKLSFPKDPEKVMTLEGVRKFLTYIEPKHFLARRAKEPEALREMAEEQPSEVIKLILSGREDRQLRQADLKAMLIGTVIADEDWTSWWSRAREILALDPFIDFDKSGGARAMIHLRDKPRTFAQEIEEGFFSDEVGPAGRIELVRQLVTRPKEAVVPVELVQRMAQRLREEWRLQGDASPIVRLEIAFMLQDLAQASPEAGIASPDPGPIFDQLEDYRDLFEVQHHEYGTRALDYLLKRDGEEGLRQAAKILPHAPVKLAQAIWETMEEQHHADLGVQALQVLFDNPLDNPDTFVWAMRATLDGSWKHLEDYFPAQAMVPELLGQMETWEQIAGDATHARDRRETAKKLLSRARTLLGADHCELLGVAVEGMTRELAGRLRRQIQSHPALSPAFKLQADRAITVTRRDLEDPAEMAALEAADGFFNCTARAQTKAMAELREITSVKIPANAKIIEEARMEGDLRENAGYQYAKEEQKMLVQKQATLSDQLQRVRLVRGADVDPARIGFGTRFTVNNLESRQQETYTLLGRWEADAERNILSEQAPLAKQFLGRKPGDTLRVERPGAPATNYEVLHIENALLGSEWDSTDTV